MSLFRSYFKSNNTLIQNNQLNVSQNPVGEISYGSPDKTVSRIIFKVDFESLAYKLIDEGINKNSIKSHKLVLTNTIAKRDDLLGGLSYSQEIERASSFELELFEITDVWDEGSGYNFSFSNDRLLNVPKQASNWFFRKTNIPWTQNGAYISGLTGGSRIIGTQYFEKGNENITIDITNYINQILFSGLTHNGLGLKFNNAIESIVTNKRRSVAFHLKHTNTFFEPFIETEFIDNINDDRNFFYMDKDNDLYLYSNRGDVVVSDVTIYDHEDKIHQVISGSAITKVKKGLYKVKVNINSNNYPDAVIFRDVWKITQNSVTKNISNRFYLINQENFYSFGLSNRLNFDNYHFSYFGIKSGELIKRGDKRRVDINVKQLYKNPDENFPLNLEYRMFALQSKDVQVDVIPFTKVDRTMIGYEFILDTTWLIPQDYYLELKISDGTVFSIKQPIGFTIVSDDAFTKS